MGTGTGILTTISSPRASAKDAPIVGRIFQSNSTATSAPTSGASFHEKESKVNGNTYCNCSRNCSPNLFKIFRLQVLKFFAGATRMTFFSNFFVSLSITFCHIT